LGEEINLPQPSKLSSSQLTMPLPVLSAGIYWLQIKTDDGLIMKKFVISQN
jgi:hypothetical protein